MGVGYTLAAGDNIHYVFGVSVGPYSAVGRELALGVCPGEGMIISVSAHVTLVYIVREADYS